MKRLSSAARGALTGAIIGAIAALFCDVLYLDVLHFIPNFVWYVFPPALWKTVNPYLLLFWAWCVYTMPLGAVIGAVLCPLWTKSR
jgi:hypothetical protein